MALEHLDEVSSGDRSDYGQGRLLTGKRHGRLHPPVVLPTTAGSIVNFDRCATGTA